MKKGVLLIATVVLIGGARLLLFSAPAAQIKVEGLSPDEIHALGWHTEPSSGLKVVGKGELVYLSGREAAGEEVLAYSWSLAGPPGSAARLDSVDTAWTTFRPDVVGKYVVTLTVSTASGTATTTETITGAEYVSVGQVDGVLFPDVRKGECAGCHSRHYEAWTATGHGTFFARAVDGQAGDHYSGNCISCHTVGFNAAPEAVNAGFDDVAAAVGWTFPATLQPGNWDDMIQNYPDLARRANIQCESCHGPGSQHRGDRSGIEISLQADVCGRCHEEAPYHRINTQWENSLHARGVASATDRAGCADCHSGYGFIARFDPQSNLRQVTGSPEVSCAVCHDPHSATNEHQFRVIENVTLENGVAIRWGGNGKLCMNCHKSRRDATEYSRVYSSHFGPHHSNQADMLAGTNANTFGRYIASSTHRNALGEACVSCHMAATPGPTEPGHDAIGGHSFAMSAGGVDNVEACVRCHGEMDSFEDLMAREDYDEDGQVEGAKAELRGLLDEVGKLLPPLGDPAVVVTEDYNVVQLRAAYNYFFVTDDGSEGMHNFQYAVGLLQLAREALLYGVLAEGSIVSLEDVPMDQGKQLSITWSRFGGDGPSEAPVEIYYVWRRLDQAAASKGAKVYATFDDVPADPAKAGNAVVNENGVLWTQVGSQPAVQWERYGAVVPTLYDSTASGVHWSVFVVSGHTASSGVYAVSLPDSAYSIDNLAPAPPRSVVAEMREANVELRWADAAEADLDYVAIYRSTVQGFDPAGTEPIATVEGATAYTDADVAPGVTYYYRLAAVDHAGNRSPFGPEVTILVTTGVDVAGGVPEQFSLHQNYPNPFNPTTTIAFDVVRAGHVRISVYDVSGKEVGVLVDQEMTPGRYEAAWRADHLASGVYICKMQTRSYVSARTMMLVK